MSVCKVLVVASESDDQPDLDRAQQRVAIRQANWCVEIKSLIIEKTCDSEK